MTAKSGTWNTQAQHLNEIGEILITNRCESINGLEKDSTYKDDRQFVQSMIVTSANPLECDS